MKVLRALFLAGCLYAVAAGRAAAVDLSPDSIEAGRKLFESNCGNCHAMKYLRYAAPLTPESAKKAFGDVPPDLSLMAAARGRGTSGAEYVYRLLTSYNDTPRKNSVLPDLSMPEPIPRDDPKLQEKAGQAAAFLYQAAFPEFRTRRTVGTYVIAYTALLTALLYLLYRSVWKGVSHSLSGKARGG